MKKIKTIGITIICLIITIFLSSYFLPRKKIIVHQLNFDSSKEIIYEQINGLRNWEKWSPWYDIDTSTVYTYNEIGEGQGAKYQWESIHLNMGKGALEIIKTTQDSIFFQISFENQAPTDGYFVIKEVDDYVNVKWFFLYDAHFNPIDRYFNLFMERALGDDMFSGLINLKNVCKKISDKRKIKVEEKDFKGVRYLSILDSCKTEEINFKMEEVLSEIIKYMEINKIDFISPPITIYHTRNAEKVVFEAGIPIKPDLDIENSGKVKILDLPECKVVVAHYFGSYDAIFRAYKELETWVEKNKKVSSDFVWEEYITDPKTEKDTSKWYTKVYFPIK